MIPLALVLLLPGDSDVLAGKGPRRMALRVRPAAAPAGPAEGRPVRAAPADRPDHPEGQRHAAARDLAEK
jgi:hypothetical protein